MPLFPLENINVNVFREPISKLTVLNIDVFWERGWFHALIWQILTKDECLRLHEWITQVITVNFNFLVFGSSSFMGLLGEVMAIMDWITSNGCVVSLEGKCFYLDNFCCSLISLKKRIMIWTLIYAKYSFADKIIINQFFLSYREIIQNFKVK